MSFLKKGNPDAMNHKQEKPEGLLLVLLTVWRELRSLILLNFNLDVFVVLPTFFVMGLYLDWPKILLIVLAVLSAVSLLAIPAAITAANRITVSMVRDENFFLYRDFWRMIPENLLKALLGALCYGGILLLLFISGMSAWQMFGPSTLFYIVLAVELSVGLVVFTASLYFWTMLGLIDLPLKPIIKNSILIVLLCWKRSLLALFAVLFVTVFLSCFTVSTGMFLLGLVFFSIGILSVNFATYPAIQRLVILREAPKKKPDETILSSGEKLTWDESEEKKQERKICERYRSGFHNTERRFYETGT